MEATKRELRLFVRADGTCPFEEFVRGLRDKQAKARIYSRIDRLRFGNFGDCRGIGEGVHELRIQHGPGWRVYFVPIGAARVVVLCAGSKRTQRSDIARARGYAKELKNDANQEL